MPLPHFPQTFEYFIRVKKLEDRKKKIEKLLEYQKINQKK